MLKHLPLTFNLGALTLNIASVTVTKKWQGQLRKKIGSAKITYWNASNPRKNHLSIITNSKMITRYKKHLPKFENILQKLEKRTSKNQNEMIHLKPKIARMCSCQARLPDCRRSSLLPLGAHLLQFVVCSLFIFYIPTYLKYFIVQIKDNCNI